MNAILISLAVVSGGAESQIPPEMKVLERMVGTWKSTSVSRVAKWTPEETRSTQTYKTELVLDGWFLSVSRLPIQWLLARTASSRPQ